MGNKNRVLKCGLCCNSVVVVDKYRKKMKSKQRLLGFFKAQLLNRRRMKSSKQRGKLSSIKSVHNQFNYCCTCRPILKKHQGNKMSASMPLIDNSSTKMTLFSNHSPILKKHRKRIQDLPEDLLAQILLRLPVKYILRCRCVQKSWYHLIQTPMFITLHLNYQKPIAHNPNPKYLFFKNAYTNALTIRVDDVQCQEYCAPKFLPGMPDRRKLAWHALSYGLICTTTLLYCRPFAIDNNIYLWNPLVQKYKTLPESPLLTFSRTEWKALAFGFVPEINDYVVVHIVKPLGKGECDPHTVIIGVYSLNTNSWKKLSQDNVSVSDVDDTGVVFVNGAAFWTGISLERETIIMCFDTKTNILCEISVPYYVLSWPGVPIIHQFGQSSIAYFVWHRGYHFFDMWVLKYDSIDEFSWEKKISIKTNEDIRVEALAVRKKYDSIDEFSWEKKIRIRTNEDIRVEALGVRNNGEPILARLFNLVSYNLDNNEASDFVESWDSWTPYPYYEMGFAPPFLIRPFVESLVLLNGD